MAYNSFPIQTTNFTDFEFLGENRTQLRSQPARIGEVVLASEFNGFAGDGVSDDIEPLRAAVAACLSEGKQTVLIPDGANCLISESLFLGYVGDETNSNYSINLMGEGGVGQVTTTIGSRITASFNDDVALHFGPGQEQSCSNLVVTSNVSASNALLRNQNGVAVGLDGGSGGAVGFTMSNMWISNFYTAFKTGVNGDTQLSEHVELDRCEIRNSAIGMWITTLQNREISVNDTRIAATTGVLGYSNPINIRGGQFGSDLQISDTLTITSVSALTRDTNAHTIGYYSFPNEGAVSGANYYTFTLTVSSPSAFQEAMLAVNGYGAMGIDTTSYGVVPICPVSYDSGTNILTCIIWPYWNMGNYAQMNIKTGTTVEAELQAATSMYVSEWSQLFVGNGINAIGIHCEQPLVLCTAMAQIAVGGGGHTNYVQGNFGWPIAHGDVGASDPIRKLQQVFPFFLQNTDSDMIIDRCNNGETTGEKVIVDQYGSGNGKVYFRNSLNFVNRINERVMFNTNFGSADPNTNYTNTTCRGLGGINSDQSLHSVYPNTDVNTWLNAGWSNSQFLGFRPMLYVTPQVAASLLTLVATGAVGTFPLLWGGQSYRVQAWDAGAPVQPWTIGDWVGFTYGRDFDGAPGNFSTVTFNAVGSSNIIALDDVTMAKAGWVLVLNNGVVDNLYICTGVWPDEGFISVCRADADAITNCGFNGTAGTTYTGNVKQQSYTMVNYP